MKTQAITGRKGFRFEGLNPDGHTEHLRNIHKST